jgi:Nuclease-related domain
MADERSTDLGAAGASALRKADRVRAERQRRAAGRSRLGRLLAIVLQPEQDKRLVGEERRWRSGAQGEQILAASLARRCPHVPMLHDRHAPPSRGNIDHIAIAASGIYVIDTKRYRGKIEVVKTLFGQPRLRIAGRDRTKLLLGLERQVAEVQAAVADLGEDVAVSGCLCFVAPSGFLADSDLPVFRTLRVNGFPLYYPRRLARRLNRTGPLSAERALQLHAGLDRRLPPALAS